MISRINVYGRFRIGLTAENKQEVFIMLKEGINGFCMALADSVPGVSGGTVAFIMGFYDKFIGSIHNLVFGKMEEKKGAVGYLAKLGVGWAAGMVLAVLVLSALFESHIYTVSSLFIGMVAISAMFLPGISGSTLLLIFGAYIPVISAVRGFLGLDFSYIPGLMFFGFGVLTGAATVVKGIKVCLEKFRPQAVYAILGMMLGSFYAIIQGPATLETPKAAVSMGNFQLTACLAGAALVIGMQIASVKSEDFLKFGKR